MTNLQMILITHLLDYKEIIDTYLKKISVRQKLYSINRSVHALLSRLYIDFTLI